MSRPHPHSLAHWLAALALGATLASACIGDLSFVRGAGAYCDLTESCVGDNYCDIATNQCTPLLAQGQACPLDASCASGACAHGVCCEHECPGACVACNLPGSVGSCEPVAADTDPFQGCPGTTVCGSDGLCQASPIWSRRFGGDDIDHATGVAVGPSGEVIVVGTFLGTVTFPSVPPYQNNDGTDAIIAKYDAFGEVAWSVRLGGVFDSELSAVAVDDSGAVVVAGSFTDQLVISRGVEVLGQLAGSGDGQADGFVAKLDDSAELSWTAVVGGDGAQRVTALALEPASGDIYIGGAVAGDVAFAGCIDVVGPMQPSRALVARVSDSGTCVDMADYGSGGAIAVAAMLIDNGGSLLVGVDGVGSVDFGNGNLAGSGTDSDVWLAKLDPQLTPIYAKHYAGAGDDVLAAMAVTSSDDVWLAGTFQGSLDLGSSDGPLESAGDRDAFIARVSPFGGTTVARGFGQSYDQRALTIAVTADDEVFVGGSFELSVDFGNGDLDATGGDDAFIAKLTANADPIWSQPVGSVMDDALTALAVDPDGSLVFVGDFASTLTLGGTLAWEGESDVFVAKLTP